MKHIHVQSLIVHKTIDPTINDNLNRGFSLESEWYNGIKFWKLISFSGSDAIWALIGSGSSTSATEQITAGENAASGNLVYLKSDGKWWKTDHLTEATMKTELRMVSDATILANANGLAYKPNTEVTLTALTVGVPYYVGANGAIVTTLPETDGIFQRYIGTAKSATILQFNPDSDYYQMSTTSSGIASITLANMQVAINDLTTKVNYLLTQV